jgi:environmental stress-induced protein Ves
MPLRNEPQRSLVHFSGDLAAKATLLAGEVRVLNVMSVRAAGGHRLAVIETWAPRHGLLVSLGERTSVGETALDRFDAALLDSDQTVTLAGPAAFVTFDGRAQ